MKKKEKLIGAGVLLCIAIIFFVVGINFSGAKNNNSDEDMFVDVLVDKSKDTKEKNSKDDNKGLSEKDRAESKSKDTTEKDEKTDTEIIVEIRGEVKSPDVYYMKDGDVLEDLIKKAGGLLNDADLSNINRAKKLNNHELVFINNSKNPKEVKIVDEGDKGSESKTNAQNPKEGDKGSNKGLININTASKEELKNIPSVGDKTADKIIDYRESSGGFKSIEDIKNVERIGDKTFEKIKDKITI